MVRKKDFEEKRREEKPRRGEREAEERRERSSEGKKANLLLKNSITVFNLLYFVFARIGYNSTNSFKMYNNWKQYEYQF